MNYVSETIPKEIRLIPYVCGAGASLPGCEGAPSAAKKFGLQTQLSDEWRKVVWQADPDTIFERERKLYDHLPKLGSAARDEIVLRNCREVSDLVEAAVKDGAMPVTIGGDHSIAAGSIAGFARAKKAHGRVGVIWIDAHADINTPETSPSLAQHGMPVAALMGLGDGDFARIGGDKAVLTPQNIMYAGLRSTDPGEDTRIAQLGIKNFTVGNFREDSFMRGVDDLASRTDYLIYSIDLDAFDPEIAPSVNSSVKDGFTRELLSVLEKSAKKHRPDMIEIVEFNPYKTGAERTYGLLRDVIKTLLPSLD